MCERHGTSWGSMWSGVACKTLASRDRALVPMGPGRACCLPPNVFSVGSGTAVGCLKMWVSGQVSWVSLGDPVLCCFGGFIVKSGHTLRREKGLAERCSAPAEVCAQVRKKTPLTARPVEPQGTCGGGQGSHARSPGLGGT